MRVAVVGGRGFIGSRAIATLKRADDVQVEVASRRGPLRIDLTDPSTFESLRGFDVVVDAADTTSSRPDALAKFCLENGITMLEASSDREAIERLQTLDRADAKGAVILGAGIFTGLSNLMCGEAAKGARSVDFAVSTTPYSGAGTGTIELMSASLAQGARAYANGESTLGPPVAKGPRIKFPSGESPTLQVSLAEPWMIHKSTNVPNVRAFFAPRPSLLVYMFLALPLWLVRTRFFRSFFGLYMAFLRKLILRSVSTRVEMVAVTDKGLISLVARDGMQTAGDAIAAMVVNLRDKKVSGVKVVDEVLELDPVLATMRDLGSSEVVLVR
jgi:hypothetical protein